jgi:hypothetical protein
MSMSYKVKDKYNNMSNIIISFPTFVPRSGTKPMTNGRVKRGKPFRSGTVPFQPGKYVCIVTSKHHTII